ncbi:interferon alpha-inducible protein 27-like protein 2B [Pseudoliparis swirei]|uniref:interferon alpha-inducible protein 27-like protein 2B n=1 Tax=Pseudoliparis swirei TaxID=2059687 RepID=UPI0024BD9C2D|nr:interferon alpha-inducible protein 27-like protein 2B [Pseudoliparis swirei]
MSTAAAIANGGAVAAGSTVAVLQAIDLKGAAFLQTLKTRVEDMDPLISVLVIGGGAAVAVVTAPFVLGAIGFTSGGIAVGSYAAGMMSTAAIANGGAVAAGSTVAVLQAMGAAGLTAAANVAVAGVGAGVGATVLGVGLANGSSGRGSSSSGDRRLHLRWDSSRLQCCGDVDCCCR